MQTKNKPDDSPVTKIPVLDACLSHVVPQFYHKLPISAQAAIAHYMAVVGEAWGQDETHEVWGNWRYGGSMPSNISSEAARAAMSEVNKFLPHFRTYYGHWQFCYTNVSTFELCVAIMRYDFPGEMLAKRLNIRQLLDDAVTSEMYATPGWPVMLSSSFHVGSTCALVENGSRRLMRYVIDNAEFVPCVWFPNKSQPAAPKEPSIKTLSKQIQELAAVVDELRGLPKRMGALETQVRALPRS